MVCVERKPGDWQFKAGYYQSYSPCCVCGTKYQTGLEPRFSYVVCETHSKLTPVQVGERRKDM